MVSIIAILFFILLKLLLDYIKIKPILIRIEVVFIIIKLIMPNAILICILIMGIFCKKNHL